MATEQDLHQAFVDYLTSCLLESDPNSVDPKIVEWVARFLDKKEFDSLPTPPENSFEADRLEKLKTKLGVDK